MSQISIKNLEKVFKVEIKKSGFKNRIKSIFNPEYKDILAVSDINLTINAGEKIAFIGPNGAGKSTTIKMLTGILTKTDGKIEVLGLDPTKDREKLVYQIGAVFGQTSRLWYHLTAKDTFWLFGKLFDIKKDDYEKRLNYLVGEFDINDFLNTPVRKLSLGQRMRCEVVASLIHKPKILFLDEPTIGLDIVAKQKLRDVINKINKEENTTIFLTSHDIGDIEEICNRVVVINHGKVIYDGDIKELKKKHIKTKIIKVKFEKTYETYDLGENVKILNNTGNYLEFEIENDKKTLQNVIEILTNKYPFEDINITEPSMENIIKTFY
nr:ATP-binding cassette domain-containing protein [Candidatus Gracilibacteria bacterium]